MSLTAAPSVITRPASTSLLAISSKDRFQDYVTTRNSLGNSDAINFSPYNFTINKNENIMNGFFTRLAVTEFTMDWVIPNVNLYTSAIGFSYQLGSDLIPNPNPIVSSIIRLPIGFYTPGELASALQTLIRGKDTTLGTAAVLYGGDYGLPYFSFSSNSTTLIAFNPLTSDPVTYATYEPNQKQLFDMLGLDKNNLTLSIGQAGVSTFGTYTDYVDVVCSQLTYNQPLKDTMSQTIVRDTLCRVYVTQIYGSLNANTSKASDTTFIPPGTRPFQIYHNFTHPKEINWTPNQPVGQLTFQIFDSSGRLVSDYVNNGSWSMSLLVTEN